MSSRRKRIRSTIDESEFSKDQSASQLISSTTTHPHENAEKKNIILPPEQQQFRMALQQQEEDGDGANKQAGQQNTAQPSIEELIRLAAAPPGV